MNNVIRLVYYNCGTCLCVVDCGQTQLNYRLLNMNMNIEQPQFTLHSSDSTISRVGPVISAFNSYRVENAAQTVQNKHIVNCTTSIFSDIFYNLPLSASIMVQ